MGLQWLQVFGWWKLDPRFCGGDNEGPRVIPASTVIPAKAGAPGCAMAGIYFASP